MTLSSCGDEGKKAYAAEIQKADALFAGQKYNDAKVVYTKALELKKDEVYPTEQIKKIDELLSKAIEDSIIKSNEANEKTKTSEAETKEVKKAESKPFHIIAGSYAIKSNATAFQKSLKSKGRKSTIVRSRNGNYLVSLNSLETITKAYNYLNTLESDSDSSLWVYRIN